MWEDVIKIKNGHAEKNINDKFGEIDLAIIAASLVKGDKRSQRLVEPEKPVKTTAD